MPHKLGEIVEDLKNSWYFRIWSLLWLVCAITTFVALVIFSREGNIEGHEGSAHIWFERAEKINFPNFEIVAPHPTLITEAKCAFLDQPVTQTACTGWAKDTDHSCVAFTASAKQGYWSNTNWYSNRIDCNITTNLLRWNNTDDNLVAWSLTDSHPAGDNALGPIWVRPTELAWILITKRQFNSKTFSGVFWDRVLEYHETQAYAGRYRIQTVIDAFFVDHIDYGTHEEGWKTVSFIGGFAFFTYILHTIFLGIIGLVLNNDSTFLNPSGSSAYAKV